MDLYYFDEAGSNLTPTISYAWQPKGERYQLPSSRRQNLTVLGFMDSHGERFLFEGAANGKVVAACMDAFAGQFTKKTVVILDQASIHTRQQVVGKIPQWKRQGLFLQFLPPYCPELNQIEILWEFVKYYWLDLSAYEDMETLKDTLLDVLQNIGSKYLITFT
ncbi:MAG: IS630 family transposase [Bacteroidota bacterium]